MASKYLTSIVFDYLKQQRHIGKDCRES